MMTMEESLELAEILGGANFFYGLRSRPAGLGCHPKNTSAIITKELALENLKNITDENDVRHGAIAYEKELTEQEISSFELIDLNIVPIETTQEVDSIINQAIPIMLEWQGGSIDNPKDVREIISELEDDGEYLLRQAFKEMPQFLQRKEQPETFKVFSKVVKTIKPEQLIESLKELHLKKVA
jgi:hypothetical protein